MKIQISQTFGRRRVMGSAKILPGVYEVDDPALFGLAAELIRDGYAVPVSDESPVYVMGIDWPVGTLVGPTHEDFEQATGRIAPERSDESPTGASENPDKGDAAPEDEPPGGENEQTPPHGSEGADGDRDAQDAEPEDETPADDAKTNALAQLAAAAALLEGRTPDVPLGEGLPLTDNEQTILEATGHPVAKPATDTPKPRSSKRK